MKNSIIIAIFLIAFALVPINTEAQCKQFAKNTCKVGLPPYQHDGNYHAAILLEGEEAELYKTFYSNTDYRVGICGASNLGNIEFMIVDGTGKILFNNKNQNYEWNWDFRLETSQQLKIVVKVPASGGMSTSPKEGCVAIMFGFKE